VQFSSSSSCDATTLAILVMAAAGAIAFAVAVVHGVTHEQAVLRLVARHIQKYAWHKALG
jgi:hypothetical protein